MPFTMPEGFADGDYPTSWTGFIGQQRAKDQIRLAAQSAKARKQPMDHILIASGTPGIGKTSLGLLAARTMGRKVLVVTGPVPATRAYGLLAKLDDRDVLFIDEAHKLVEGGKKHAEWLLHYLQDGILLGAPPYRYKPGGGTEDYVTPRVAARPGPDLHPGGAPGGVNGSREGRRCRSRPRAAGGLGAPVVACHECLLSLLLSALAEVGAECRAVARSCRRLPAAERGRLRDRRCDARRPGGREVREGGVECLVGHLRPPRCALGGEVVLGQVVCRGADLREALLGAAVAVWAVRVAARLWVSGWFGCSARFT